MANNQSPWVFGCELGLQQDTCGKYEADEESRGFGRWNGCASCIHREPANARTESTEARWLETGHPITAHKGGRSVSKRTDVTPEVAEMLADLKARGVSLGDIVDEAVRERHGGI